jgi:peroxiredoxin 2/4
LLAWSTTARKEGGLGNVNIPLFSDKNHKLAKDYGVLIEEDGVALRGLFIIDPKGIIRQVSARSSIWWKRRGPNFYI